MRIAVLGSSASWYLKDLQRAAEGRHTILPVSFQELRSSVNEEGFSATSGEVDLAACDCLLVRTMAPGSLEQVVFRMDVLGRLEGAGVCVLNPARAIEGAVDKYLTTAKLQEAGLLVPPTIACQTADQAIEAFHQLGGDVVIKPLFGAEGRGIARLQDEAMAHRAFRMLEQLQAVLYLQPFLEHEGYDLRLLVIGDEVLGMRRVGQGDWRTNVSRGAKTEPLEVTPQLAQLAHRAADALGAPLAGVDLLPTRDGRLYVLEVNAVPGWRALARTLTVDVAAMMLDAIQRETAAAARHDESATRG